MSYSQHSTTLTQLLELYLKHNRRIKWSTRSITRIAFNCLVEFADDSLDFDAELFQGFLLDRGLVPRSVNSYIKTIRPIFGWAVRRKHISINPFDGLKMFRTTTPEIFIYSEAELCDLLASADSNIWRARIWTAASAGLRKSEILNLTVNDIDFEKGFIKIQPKKEAKHTWSYDPKSYQCRRVPLVPELANLFTQILAELPEGYPYLMITEKRYWHIENRRSTGKLSDRTRLNPDENFWKPYSRIKKRAGIQKGTFHDLRRTCITNWTWHLPPQETKKLAGHAEYKTTMKYYSAVRPDILQRASECSLLKIGATGLEPATS